MAQILYRGILGGTHSWAVVGGELCLALARLGYDIGVFCTGRESEIHKEELKQLVDRSNKRAHIGIGYTIPRNLRLINADKKLCIYNYETTVMPPGWVKDLNRLADLVLPSSNFTKSIFAQNGVARNKMHVLPHGVDVDVYNPGVPPLDIGTQKFMFLCVAEPHARKGYDLLLRAYAEEFASNEDVILVIKTSLKGNRHKAHYEINIRDLLTRFRKTHALPEVRVITEKLESLAPLYTAADCFVLPSRSECFCIPALEAMACKLPVIITGYGGQTDFATKANSFLISYKMTNAPKSMQYWHFDPRGKLAEPDLDHLKVLMRYAYKHREEMKKRAELAYEQVLPRYTWDNVAEQLMNIVKAQNWSKRFVFLQKKVETPQPTVDSGMLEETRDKSYQRVVAQRRERLQLLEQEIVAKRMEVEQLRKQLSINDICQPQHYEKLESPFSGKVSIVVLNYNTKESTLACIHSIQKCTRGINYEIIVVDNGSTDGSVEALEALSDVRLITNGVNFGVAKGWNIGIQATDPGNDVVVLNSDILVEDGWLLKLNRVAYEDTSIGVVGCRMKGHKNHSGHLLHTGALIKKDGMGEENKWGLPLRDYGQHKINRPTQIVVGACMYLKREVLDKVGSFDEDYTPAYFEDSDMCMKIAKAGYKVYYCGEVTLQHEHGATSRANNINAASLLSTNRTKFVKKWGTQLARRDCTVEVRGPIFGPSGYAEACRNLTEGLWENRVGVAFKPITAHPSEHKHHSKNLNLIVQDALNSNISYDTAIVFYLAEYFAQLQGKKRRIGYTMLEVDGVPSSWVQHINEHLTELWVPSVFNQHTFKKSGVQVPIRVVPLGVDTDRFNPHVDPILPKTGRFSFICVCEWGERKNVHLLLRAFQAEFKKTEPVQLILRIGSHDPAVSVERELAQYDLRNIVLLNREYDVHQMASLYRSADCFVLPSSGEGWGLPYAEAMACGLATIGTAWSANVDFMNDDNSYLLRAERIVPAVARCPLYAGFNWALPDVGHLRRLMRHVYENQEEARMKGMVASEHILNNYSLLRVGEIAKAYLMNEGKS